jgi:hypothetical protein
VQILDNRTIAIPERPGNRRADTFRNVLQNRGSSDVLLIEIGTRLADDAAHYSDIDMKVLPGGKYVHTPPTSKVGEPLTGRHILATTLQVITIARKEVRLVRPQR